MSFVSVPGRRASFGAVRSIKHRSLEFQLLSGSRRSAGAAMMATNGHSTAMSANGHSTARSTNGHSTATPANGHRKSEQIQANGLYKSERMVHVRRFGPVALISLDGKIRANAMTPEMGAQLREEVELLCDPNTPSGKDLGCVVLTGVNNAFLSGGHYEHFFQGRKDAAAPKSRASRQENEDFMYKFFTDFLSFRKLPVPVIAAINGHAVGAGLGPAMGADIRICCATHGRMSANFVKLGVMPGTGMTHMFPMIVGEAVATQMLLTGEMIDSRRAKEIQLVTESVDLDYRPAGFKDPQMVNGLPVPSARDIEKRLLADKLYQGSVPGVVLRALEMGLQISANAPMAVRGTMRAMRSRQEGSFVREDTQHKDLSLFERQLRVEAKEQGLSWESTDFEIGLDAMAAKRKPAFPTHLYEMPEAEQELIEENEAQLLNRDAAASIQPQRDETPKLTNQPSADTLRILLEGTVASAIQDCEPTVTESVDLDYRPVIQPQRRFMQMHLKKQAVSN